MMRNIKNLGIFCVLLIGTACNVNKTDNSFGTTNLMISELQRNQSILLLKVRSVMDSQDYNNDILTATIELYNFIQECKFQLTSDSLLNFTLKNDYNKNDIKLIANLKNYYTIDNEIVSKYMIGDANDRSARELKEILTFYKKILLENQIDDTYVQIINTCIHLDDQNVNAGYVYPWERFYFENKSVDDAVLILTQLQNNALNCFIDYHLFK